MAIVQNPLIGRTRKQTGGQVFSTVFGQNIMRSKPASYNDKQSAAQLIRRSIMSMLATALSFIKSALPDEFLTPPVGMAPYSKALSQLLAGFTGAASKLIFNPLGITFGSGTSGSPIITNVAGMSLATHSISWDPAVQNPAIPHTATIDAIIINLNSAVANQQESVETLLDETFNVVLPFGTVIGDKLIILTSWNYLLDGEMTKTVKTAIIQTVTV